MNKVLIIMVNILVINVISQSISFASSPDDVVKKYCELDANGARVFPGMYNDIRVLMAWDEDQDEPGWDCYKIIDNYELSRVNLNDKSAVVRVKYNIVGMVCGNRIKSTLHEKEYVDFDLVSVGDGWLVREYVVYPHVYKKVGVQLLSQTRAYIGKVDNVTAEEIDKYINILEPNKGEQMGSNLYP